MRRAAALGPGLMLVAVLLGCRGGRSDPERAVATGGNAARGRAVIQAKGCGSCHTIPGIRGARGMVGPPLIGWARRSYIAGRLPNQPENLVRWVQAPSAVDPHTAMPDLGLTAQEARDVAAYLYTLR